MPQSRDKAYHRTIDREFLAHRETRAKGYPKAKWIEFCEAMLDRGYTCTLREALESVSKYITVFNLGVSFTVRYSNHGATPIPDDPCDFFVGKNRFCTTNTAQAIKATIAALGPSPFGGTP